jgi:4-hydroxybenzoate polyprenyltransferase
MHFWCLSLRLCFWLIDGLAFVLLLLLFAIPVTHSSAIPFSIPIFFCAASIAFQSYYKAKRTKNRCKDLDQVQDEVAAVLAGKPKALPVDEDLPGLGQHYCLTCS